MSGALGPIRVVALSAAWRVGSRRAGRALVRALSSSDEPTRMAAGVILSRSPRRSERFLVEGLERRDGLPEALTVLAGTGGPQVERIITRYLSDDNPEVVESARQALGVLHVRRRIHADTGF